MALHNSRPTVGMIVTSDRIAITIAITTKTNEQEMIAVDQTREIAPTLKRAVRAAQVVTTTETVHTSTMRKRSTRKQTTHDEIIEEPHTKTKRSVHTRQCNAIAKSSRKTKKNKKRKTIKSKLGNGILKTSVQELSDENFHSYNSLVLKDDLAFRRTHFRIIPPVIPRIYQHDTISDITDDLPLQNRSTSKNNKLLKIAIMIAINTCSKDTSHAIIDSGASCRVTPHIEDFINQPTPIQNTTLKGIAGGLTALGRGTVQLKIQQENQENIILIVDNVIYAPDCPV
jgi:hypothetical protein